MENKIRRKFSISIRKETEALLNRVAHIENRTRSSLIDVICLEYCRKTLKVKDKDENKD